jgi:mannose-6-phosphate isomerase-like protein (cupin superfamily)
VSHPPILPSATEPFTAGDSLENPCTGELGVLVKAPWEGPDSSLEADLHVQPGGAVVGEHIHHDFDERFTVKAGRIAFRLDGVESVAGSEEVVEIPRGHWHDWWNAGDEEAVARVWVSDGTRFLQMIETLFGLAQDGHTNDKGMPDPLQLAMFATEFHDVMVLRRPPAAVQSAIFALLRPLARARGYRGTYPQYGRSLLRPAA